VIDHNFSVRINQCFARFEANLYLHNDEFRDVIHDYFTESPGWDEYRVSPMEWAYRIPPHLWDELVTLKTKEEAERAYHKARNLTSQEFEAMDIATWQLGGNLPPASY